MTSSLLDFSQRPELSLHASVVADVEAAAAPAGTHIIIVGAFARDLHLQYRYAIDTQRQTEDVDIALAVPDWQTFEALKSRLIDSGSFRTSGSPAHSLTYRSNLPVDLVPFGRVETADRRIAWPPHGEIVMDVFGFREALATAHRIMLPDKVQSHVVSLPALALLKIVCWQDRHYQYPGKDAHDLSLIIRNYLAAGNEERLWNEFVAWTEEDDFNFERAGARMLGHDIRLLLDDAGIERIGAILSEQSDQDIPALLPSEMSTHEPERARALLKALLQEILQGTNDKRRQRDA
jgi:predicted nucleotidyltransferase